MKRNKGFLTFCPWAVYNLYSPKSLVRILLKMLKPLWDCCIKEKYFGAISISRQLHLKTITLSSFGAERFKSIVWNLMQLALRFIKNWCKEYSLSVNSNKAAEMILFANKRVLNLAQIFGHIFDTSWIGANMSKQESIIKQVKL